MSIKPLPEKITTGEKYDPAMNILDQDKTDEYFELCVQHNMARGTSREEAESIERQNLGYYAGYYSDETRKRVEKLFHAQHPIFGSGTPTTEEALEAGRNFAEGVTKSKNTHND